MHFPWTFKRPSYILHQLFKNKQAREYATPLKFKRISAHFDKLFITFIIDNRWFCIVDIEFKRVFKSEKLYLKQQIIWTNHQSEQSIKNKILNLLTNRWNVILNACWFYPIRLTKISNRDTDLKLPIDCGRIVPLKFFYM